MTAEELKRAREICDAATPGPWSWHGKYYKCLVGPKKHDIVFQDSEFPEDGFLPPEREDAKFIVEARTLLPKALDALEAVRAQLQLHKAPWCDPDIELEDIKRKLQIAVEALEQVKIHAFVETREYHVASEALEKIK